MLSHLNKSSITFLSSSFPAFITFSAVAQARPVSKKKNSQEWLLDNTNTETYTNHDLEFALHLSKMVAASILRLFHYTYLTGALHQRILDFSFVFQNRMGMSRMAIRPRCFGFEEEALSFACGDLSCLSFLHIHDFLDFLDSDQSGQINTPTYGRPDFFGSPTLKFVIKRFLCLLPSFVLQKTTSCKIGFLPCWLFPRYWGLACTKWEWWGRIGLVICGAFCFRSSSAKLQDRIVNGFGCIAFPPTRTKLPSDLFSFSQA